MKLLLLAGTILLGVGCGAPPLAGEECANLGEVYGTLQCVPYCSRPDKGNQTITICQGATWQEK